MEHDANTCIRCRLFKLIDELTPEELDEDCARDILTALADAAGMMLAQLNDQDTRVFFAGVIIHRKEHREELHEMMTAVRH